tara:strand:- start:3443 stop:3832 length:390 start_codon:yes stop_codon:yes gene_type:complete
MKTKGFILAIIVIIIGYLSYNYMYQEHRNVLEEKASFSMSSIRLYSIFNNTSTESHREYLNKIIEFDGLVNSINEGLLVIKPNIVCKLDSNFSIANLNIGDTLILKGRCIGFDDLFMEVKMDNVSFKQD